MSEISDMDPRPSAQISRFVGSLRRNGFDVGVRETVDSVRTVVQCDPPDVETLQAALRSLLCRDREDWDRFDVLFERFWYPERFREEQERVEANRDIRMRGVRSGGTAGLGHTVDTDALSDEPGDGMPDTRRGGAGRQTALAKSDFRFLTDPTAIRDLERFAERLARRVRKRLQRRRKNVNRREQIHVRRTLRRSLAHGGLPLRLAFRRRRRRLPRLMMILDVSHSMAQYSVFLGRFMRGLVLAFPDAEAFVFHTRLIRVTDPFRQSDPSELRRRLEGMSQVWFGGTRIADSLAHFERDFAVHLLDGKTIVLIMSDGFDTDDPSDLAAVLQRIRARASKVVWLNPMMGRQGYLPEEGMAAVLPHLDHLAPGHSLQALNDVSDYLAAL